MKKHDRINLKVIKYGRSLFLTGIIIVLFLFSMYHQVLKNSNNEGTDIAPLQSAYPVSGTPLNEIEDEIANGLGEISILDLDFRGKTGDPYFSEDAVNITYSIEKDDIFLETVKPASIDTAWGSGSGYRSANISILINQTITWTFNSTPKGYVVGFSPNFDYYYLKNMYLNDTRLDVSDYFLKYYNLVGFFYNFQEEYDEMIGLGGIKGILEITYEYEALFPITNWQVYCPGPEQYIENNTQTITQNFRYNMTIGKNDLGLNTTAQFLITFPNPEFIENLQIDDVDGKSESELLAEMIGFTHVYERIGKTVKIILNTTEPHTLNANFDADFTVSFIDVVNGSWCEDRLVNGTTTRERDYKITVTDGPPDLALTYIWFNETSIWFPDVLRVDSTTSRLGRGVQIVNMNKSIITPDTLPLDNLPEEEQPTYTDGISFIGVKSPDRFYLYPNEVDIITIRYIASRTLTVVIMDSIRTPLPNYQVKFHIGSSVYGPRLSLYDPISYPTKTSDSNGQIVLRNVPISNFTVEILDSKGNFVQNMTANTTTPINFLVTNLVHFPTTILVISGISVAFIMIGIVVFKRNSALDKR